jgi:hypothetical protein
MQVYQIVNDCITDGKVYATKEAAAMKVLEIVMNAKETSTLADLLRVEVLEVH